MICVRLNGGLGNQMFQYAMGKALAVSHNTELIFDTSLLNRKTRNNTTIRNFDLNAFDIDIKEATPTQLAKVTPLFYKVINVIAIKLGFKGIALPNYFIEQKFSYDKRIEKIKNQCFLVGYWQSPRYFNKIQATIRQEFKFPVLSGNNINIADQISSCNAISLHVRRGDFLNLAAHGIHGICSLEYYQEAITFIKKKIEKPVFFIFSDDLTWVETNLNIKEECYYITDNIGEKSYIDMQLMSLCKHNIIANSSFSWWGAWLNSNREKIVIAPQTWFANKRLNDETADLIPKEWIRM